MMYARQGLLDEYEAAVDRLNRVDLGDVRGDELQAAVLHHERIKAKLAAFESRLMRTYDASREWALEGALKPEGLMGAMLRVPSKTFGRQRSVARALGELPMVEAALARAEISPSHRDKLLAIDNRRVHDALVRDQALLVGWAATMRWKDFEHAVAEWLEVEDQDGPEPRDVEGNRAHWSRTFGGRVRIDADLDPVGGAIWKAEADRLERLEFEADRAEAEERLGRAPKKWELRRTDAQRRAAAMVTMARRSATGPEAGRKGKVLVSVFAGPDWFRKMAELDDGTVVRPGQLVPWIDDVSFEAFLYDATLRDISVTEMRTFRGAQRRFALGRHGECVHPHCDEPVSRSQADHRVPHSKGGPTAGWNVDPRCGGHNRAKGNKDPAGQEPDP